jgi:hypothetical protein
LHSVRAMPTFIALMNRQETGRVQGADPHGLERIIQEGLTRMKAVAPPAEHVANEVERRWLNQFVGNAERVNFLIN